MVDFYHYNAKNFNGNDITTTIATGPVVIDENGNFLLHKAESTGKYQFTGGRLDDTKSSQNNAVYRPFEDLGVKVQLIKNVDPFVVVNEIQRDGVKEVLTLIHYLAKIEKDSIPTKGDWKWFSLEKVLLMDKNNEVSSPNIKLACEYFNSYNK